MPQVIVTEQAGWNANGQFQESRLYWEDGFIHDNEWIDDNCFIMRIDQCLWIETSIYDVAADGSRTLRSRTRARQQCYVLARKICKDTTHKIWTEPSDLTDPVTESWDVDSEFWRTQR
jgi:hypothetical protein